MREFTCVQSSASSASVSNGGASRDSSLAASRKAVRWRHIGATPASEGFHQTRQASAGMAARLRHNEPEGSEMINSTEQEDRKAQRKKQEERARAASEARKRTRQEELRR